MAKKASEVVVGDKLCEADGFMWEVVEIVGQTAAYITFGVRPVFQSMLGEKPTTTRIRKTSNVRLA